MKPHHRFQLPDDLPPQTALALFDLLSALTDAFWHQYESELLDLILKDPQLTSSAQQPLDFDDEFSF